MNPCPCGYLGHPTRACRCSPTQIRHYIGRISGPLLDRFDLRIHVPPVERGELARMQPGEASAVIAERVLATRRRQYRRLGDGRVNARMSSAEIELARPPGQRRRAAARRSDAALLAIGPQLSPDPEGGAHDRRSGRIGTSAQRAYRRSAAVSRRGAVRRARRRLRTGKSAVLPVRADYGQDAFNQHPPKRVEDATSAGSAAASRYRSCSPASCDRSKTCR